MQAQFQSSISIEADLEKMRRDSQREQWKRAWYKFSRNSLSLVGAGTIAFVIFLAVFAPYVAPFPKHAGPFTDFTNATQSPNAENWFGTDDIGRDILSRVIFGFRFSLILGVVVLAIVVPIGVLLGLIAGYYKDTWLDTVIMRVTDVFLAVPP